MVAVFRFLEIQRFQRAKKDIGICVILSDFDNLQFALRKVTNQTECRPEVRFVANSIKVNELLPPVIACSAQARKPVETRIDTMNYDFAKTTPNIALLLNASHID